jgi:hypothetical protein
MCASRFTTWPSSPTGARPARHRGSEHVLPVLLPRQQRDPPARRSGRGTAMTGGRIIRLGTGAVVCAVAGFAAVVSYSHI